MRVPPASGWQSLRYDCTVCYTVLRIFFLLSCFLIWFILYRNDGRGLPYQRREKKLANIKFHGIVCCQHTSAFMCASESCPKSKSKSKSKSEPESIIWYPSASTSTKPPPGRGALCYGRAIFALFVTPSKKMSAISRCIRELKRVLLDMKYIQPRARPLYANYHSLSSPSSSLCLLPFSPLLLRLDQRFCRFLRLGLTSG